MAQSALLNQGFKFDSRTKTGRFFRAAKAELRRQLDHPPTVGEDCLLDQCVMWRYQIGEYSERFLKGGLSVSDRNIFIGMTKQLNAAMNSLGLMPMPPDPDDPKLRTVKTPPHAVHGMDQLVDQLLGGMRVDPPPYQPLNRAARRATRGLRD